MSFSPFDPTAALMLGVFLPPPLQGAAVLTSKVFAGRLAGLGFYGPFRVRHGDPVIVDRANQPLIHVLPVIDGPGDRRMAAEISCLALNMLCGFEAAEEHFDTIDLAATVIRQLAVPAFPKAAE